MSRDRLTWFYPALMILVGAHYRPFVFLYGMPMFWILGGWATFRRIEADAIVGVNRCLPSGRRCVVSRGGTMDSTGHRMITRRPRYGVICG